jgi:hypothetical protein
LEYDGFIAVDRTWHHDRSRDDRLPVRIPVPRGLNQRRNDTFSRIAFRRCLFDLFEYSARVIDESYS